MVDSLPRRLIQRFEAAAWSRWAAERQGQRGQLGCGPRYGNKLILDVSGEVGVHAVDLDPAMLSLVGPAVG